MNKCLLPSGHVVSLARLNRRPGDSGAILRLLCMSYCSILIGALSSKIVHRRKKMSGYRKQKKSHSRHSDPLAPFTQRLKKALEVPERDLWPSRKGRPLPRLKSAQQHQEDRLARPRIASEHHERLAQDAKQRQAEARAYAEHCAKKRHT